MGKVDLHIHSSHSDGSDDIKSLAESVISSGLKTFALTDHDTVAGCSEMAALTKNIKFIKGVELTCKTGDISCHILGFNCDCTNKTLLDLIEKGKSLRRQKLETRINYLKDVHNIEFTKEELDWLYSRTSVVKTHIANLLVQRGLADDNVSAMKKYLDNCKTGNTKFSIEEAINAINASGGIPVWAHPLGGEGEEHLKQSEFLPKLNSMIAYGIKGLECYYSRYNKEEEKFLVNCAKSNNLFISGGSDYHGLNKDIPIGKLNSENIDIGAENLNILNII